MSDRPIVTGTFSASMTIFSTAVVLLLVQDDLSIVFAGLLSAIISNSLSDGLSVTTGGNMSWDTFGKVALAEIGVGLPFLIVILYFTLKQRKQNTKTLFGGKSPTLSKNTRALIILIIASLNATAVVIVMLWQGNKNDWLNFVWLIPLVILFTVGLTFFTEKRLFPSRPSFRK
jgi:hypothetical protein